MFRFDGKYMDVSIIIVNYNTKELTRNCLKSVFEQTKDLNFEVIISDNGSSDGSVEMIKAEFPQVILIENKENLGFGAANNRGLAIAKGKYIFYLNSDTVLLNNAVKIFFDYWENTSYKLGALGCVLLNSQLQEIHSSGSFPSYKSEIRSLRNCILDTIGLKIFIKKIIGYENKIEKRGIVDYVIGADLFMLNNKFAVFDERFFMYYEECDMLYSLYKSNYKSLIIEGPQIIHLCGGSETLKSKRYSFKKKTSLFFWDSCLKYFEKNNKKNVCYFLLKAFVKFVYLFPSNYIFYIQNHNLVGF